MSYFSIAGLQLELEMHNNLDLLVKKTEQTCTLYPWVNMVVYSELALTGAGKHNIVEDTEVLEQALCDLARRLNIWLVPGSYYQRVDSDILNHLTVINPQGEIVARYNKIYPFLPYEKDVANGDQFVTFDVPDVGTFGVSICYDMWIPETIRALVCQGAEVIIHPTMTGTIDRELELCIARTHAITNQCYFVDINGSGDQGNGQSIIVGPEGDVIYQADRTEQVIAVELDLSRVRRTRERGIHGLGQPLKSFRDNPIEFPQYKQEGAVERESAMFSNLGKLEVPK
ncbi:carbon-nitrogen hydrolase family protein [Vibrio kyushuensis]|uniref:carbon-nitrogen hydrolase family protein n=1 Tax=Vibrio kyushuensis TaxID=2910249 RepID=UPI003D11D84B